METARLILKDRMLRIEWADGDADEFHYIWLRDHGASGSDLHPETGERIVDFHAIPLDVRPREATLQGDRLRVVWSDERETHHGLAWLRGHAYGDAQLRARLPQPRLWRSEMQDRIPRYDYGQVLESETLELRFLTSVLEEGFAILQGAPAVPGEMERLARHLGYLREVCFGRLRDVRVEPQAYNVAFTNSVVKPHTDLANYAWPPGLQMLHCLVQEASGGDNRLVDGFRAAEDLRQEDPEAFEALTRVDVGFQIASRRADVQTRAPILSVGPMGELRLVRFSNQARRDLSCPAALVEPFYRGLHRLSALVNEPGNQIRFRLAPGEILAMNNHRVLHARDPFDPSKGRRHLQIGSMELDAAASRVRIISARLNDRSGTAMHGG